MIKLSKIIKILQINPKCMKFNKIVKLHTILINLVFFQCKCVEEFMRPIDYDKKLYLPFVAAKHSIYNNDDSGLRIT